MGYIMANPQVIREFIKVRQPYSVDAVSQAVARVVYANRATFDAGASAIIAERERMMAALQGMPGVEPYPSDSNWILVKLDRADEAWQHLYDNGVLVRDFSKAPALEDTLRITIGTAEQNDRLLRLLGDFAASSA